VIKPRRKNWAKHWKIWETGEVYMGVSGGDLRKRDYLENPDLDRRIILKWIKSL
jgi:hypothetical protein